MDDETPMQDQYEIPVEGQLKIIKQVEETVNVQETIDEIGSIDAQILELQNQRSIKQLQVDKYNELNSVNN